MESFQQNSASMLGSNSSQDPSSILGGATSLLSQQLLSANSSLMSAAQLENSLSLVQSKEYYEYYKMQVQNQSKEGLPPPTYQPRLSDIGSGGDAFSSANIKSQSASSNQVNNFVNEIQRLKDIEETKQKLEGLSFDDQQLQQFYSKPN